MGPSPGPTGGWSLMWRIIGRTKASVLPEPVLAMPMQSLGNGRTAKDYGEFKRGHMVLQMMK